MSQEEEMDPQKRIDEALYEIDSRVDILINRPGMVTGTHSYHTAENILTIILSIRASLVGGDYDYRKYCFEQYPQIPGSVRCIASYLDEKWDKDPDGDGPKFEAWKHESSKFVAWAMEEMTKMDEKIIAEAKYYNPSIEYDLQAKPDKWITFLGEAVDEESQIILQEWFGYCLTNDTNLQKMLLLDGDRETGKSTVVEVLRRLIGPQWHTRATIRELAGPCGLNSIMGRNAVFVSIDQSQSTLRVLSNRLAKVAEDIAEDGEVERDHISMGFLRILSVSAEEAMPIERRYEETLIQKLDARFIIENGFDSEPVWPHEFDRRMVRARFGKSEKLKDSDVLTDLFKEMPGILNWALEGLVRLRRAGRFTKLKINQ